MTGRPRQNGSIDQVPVDAAVDMRLEGSARDSFGHEPLETATACSCRAPASRPGARGSAAGDHGHGVRGLRARQLLAGVFLCDDYRNAGTKERSIAALERLDHERESGTPAANGTLSEPGTASREEPATRRRRDGIAGVLVSHRELELLQRHRIVEHVACRRP